MIISEKVSDGDTIELPSDLADVSISTQTSGFATSIFLLVICDGETSAFDIDVYNVDEETDVELGDYDHLATAHNKYRNWIIVTLTEKGVDD